MGWTTSTNVATRVENVANEYGDANGGGVGTDNGGEAMAGQAVLNSSLDDPLTVGGEYCRGWLFSLGNDTNASFHDWCGTATINTGSGGAHYPITGSPADGTFIACSTRAFLRVGAVSGSRGTTGSVSPFVNGSASVGSYIGLTAKARIENETDLYQSGNDDEWYAADLMANSGYNCFLSSCCHGGLDYNTTVAVEPRNENLGFGGVRLVIGAWCVNDIDNTNLTTMKVEIATGSYAFNTWYHVRMDVIPNIGQDIIRIYTASIDDTVGEENWGIVHHYTASGGTQYYRAWDDVNGNNKFGYHVGACTDVGGTEAANGQAAHDVYIDRFQFLTKDVSGSV